MSYSNYPNGFSGGVVIRGIPITVTHPGEVFWVNSTTVLPTGGFGASNQNKGTFLAPVTTITKALTLCTASRGDIIMVMPGYTETVSAAAGLALDVAGVAIIGLGSGGIKPVITSSATGSTITVTANNVTCFNLRFVATTANITLGLSVTGEDFQIDSCEFMSDEAADSFLTSIITTSAAEGFSATNCTFNYESTVAGVSVTDVPASGIETLADRSFIGNNTFLGSFSVAAIFNQTDAILGSTIIDNDIYNINTAAAGLISVAAGCTGLIMRNMGYGNIADTTTIDTLIVNPAMAMSENYACNTLTESGGVVGTPST